MPSSPTDTTAKGALTTTSGGSPAIPVANATTLSLDRWHILLHYISHWRKHQINLTFAASQYPTNAAANHPAEQI